MFSKVTIHKVNIQKSIIFLYISNEQFKIENLKSTIYNSIKKHQILRYTFYKICAQCLYAENYKTVMKEDKEDLNKWRLILYSWVERVNVVKMPIFSDLYLYLNFNQNSSKFL